MQLEFSSKSYMSFSKIFISSCLLFLSIFVKSQNISKYLDDGTNRTAHNLLSIGFDPINISFPVKFERRVVRNFAYVVAVAPLIIEKQRWFDEFPSIKPTGIGFSASVRAKIYAKAFPERTYFNLYPQISVMDGKIFIDACLGGGYQRIIFRKITISADIGFGFRYFKDTNYGVLEGETGWGAIPYFPVSVNLGYLF